jgi:hypothetical protein
MKLAGLQGCIAPTVPAPRSAAPPHFVYVEFGTFPGCLVLRAGQFNIFVVKLDVQILLHAG